MKKDDFKIGKRIIKSRLIVGTGKYKNFKQTADAVKASGADMVTVAVRRVNILDKKKPILMDYLDPKKNYLFTKYSRMLYIKRRSSNFKTGKRNGRLETRKIRSSW